MSAKRRRSTDEDAPVPKRPRGEAEAAALPPAAALPTHVYSIMEHDSNDDYKSRGGHIGVASQSTGEVFLDAEAAYRCAVQRTLKSAQDNEMCLWEEEGTCSRAVETREEAVECFRTATSWHDLHQKYCLDPWHIFGHGEFTEYGSGTWYTADPCEVTPTAAVLETPTALIRRYEACSDAGIAVRDDPGEMEGRSTAEAAHYRYCLARLDVRDQLAAGSANPDDAAAMIRTRAAEWIRAAEDEVASAAAAHRAADETAAALPAGEKGTPEKKAKKSAEYAAQEAKWATESAAQALAEAKRRVAEDEKKEKEGEGDEGK